MVVVALHCDGTPRLAWAAILSAWVKLFAPILEGKYAWRALVICISSRGGASCRSSWGGSCCSSSCYPWMEWPKLISYERYLAWTWLSHLHKLQSHHYHRTPSPLRDRRRLPWIGCTPCHSYLWHPCAKIQQRIIVCFLQMFAATAKKRKLMTWGSLFYCVSFSSFQVTNLPSQFWALLQLFLSALLSAVHAGSSKKPLSDPVMVRISSKISSVSHMTRPRSRFLHMVMALDHFPCTDFETLYSLIKNQIGIR